MAGRAAVLAWEEAKAANPCVLGDHQGSYEYGGMKYELVAHPAGASFKLLQQAGQDGAAPEPGVRGPAGQHLESERQLTSVSS